MSKERVETATTYLSGRPKYLQPAPTLVGGACSDCRVPMTGAGNGDLKICPQCYGLLWHRDFVAEARRKHEEQERVRLLELRAAKAEQAARKERAKQGTHQRVQSQDKMQQQAMLKYRRQRLVELLWARSWMLYAQRH